MKLLAILLESKEIKRLIVKRSFDYNIPLRYVCLECGISYQDFMQQYINVMNKSTIELSEDKFRKLLSILGISIRYQVVIDSEMDMGEQSKRLSIKYENN